jgi:hypothetical protein
VATEVTPRVAILYPGDRAARDRADPRESRFAELFVAFAASGAALEAAVYHDDFVDEVHAQLRRADAVLVWHNPIEGGRTRRVLDAMLREVAEAGVLVSAHPDTILRLGTKDVLPAVRGLAFGSDAWRVEHLGDLSAVRQRLGQGPRVLKQHRGHSGIGVWRVDALGGDRFRVQHAQRGASAEDVDLDGLRARLAPYFVDGGHMVDQAWQPRIAEGMVRAYLVRDRVAGFGHQAINALHPGIATGELAAPGPRLYTDADDARFQVLRRRLEQEWVAALCEATSTRADRLPLLWDADFMFGERAVEAAEERYVLCEVNVSSVSPFPPAAIDPLVRATLEALAARARE